jgi:hypothetical protein
VALVPKPAARPTRITSIPSSVRLGTERRPDVLSAGEARESKADRYEIYLEVSGSSAAVRLSARDVEHGVLIGRNEKCIDAGLRKILTEYCSRVHALVIREGDSVFLYDTASTIGTYYQGGRARCVALSDEGTEVHLAGRHGVTMRWRGQGS